MTVVRTLFFGMSGILSLAPLTALLDAGYPVAAVVTPAAEGGEAPWRRLHAPGSPSELPLATPYVERNIVHLAWEREIPVFEAGDLRERRVRQGLRDLAPDLVCVSCFPRRIPGELLALPGHGFLNLHPALLPAYRGPHPLFWQLRDGLRESGVTLHFMSHELDAGDIALQARLSWRDGLSGAELEQLAGERGGALFVEALQRLEAGALPRRPQPAGGSYQPRPTAADFEIDPTWSARRAFNFMRGTAHWGFAYPLRIGGRTVRLRRAVAYDAQRRLPAPVVAAGPEVLVQLGAGVLRATWAG